MSVRSSLQAIKKRLLQQRFLYESFEVHCCEDLQHFETDAERFI